MVPRLKSQAQYVFLVNELNFAVFIYRVLTQRCVAYVSVACFTLVGQALLKPLVLELHKRKFIGMIAENMPAAGQQSVTLIPYRVLYTAQSDYSVTWQALAKTEGVHFHIGAEGTLQAQNGWLADYLYKKEYLANVASYLAANLEHPVILSGLQPRASNITNRGNSRLFAAATAISVLLTRLCYAVANLVNLLSLTFVAFIFLLLRVRRRVAPIPVSFAMYRRIWDYHIPSFARLIQRSRVYCYDPESEKAAQFCRDSGISHLAYIKDTQIRLGAVPQFIFIALYCTVRDYCRFLTYNPVVCKNLLLCRFKAAVYENFFWQYKTDYLFCTADYIPDHAIRSAALRRAGGTPIGIAHGVANYPPYPNWQFLDYDLYFGMSLNLYKQDYLGTWSQNMVFQAIRTPHGERETYGPAQKSNTVTWFLFPEAEEDWLVSQVRTLASGLPGHQIHIRPKPGVFVGRESMLDKLSQLKLANLRVQTTESAFGSYELLTNSKYCITTGSTMTIEAIQFNTIPFCLDPYPNLVNFFYRRHPFLCYPEIGLIVRRIREIEMHPASFFWEPYHQLAEIDAPTLRERLELLQAGNTNI